MNYALDESVATTTLHDGLVNALAPDFASITDGTEEVVPVSVIDRSGTDVVHADITCWVTPA